MTSAAAGSAHNPPRRCAAPSTAETVAHTHAEALDFGEALHYARRVGLPGLLALDFQQRAARLKALAKYLGERKEELYAISAHTGATRNDGWIDIEGGTGTLFLRQRGRNELPSAATSCTKARR
jgi:oxepin-CoA hydrolase/3-oxo-5,6-dehydrosuberyl-CoA semialdehyde dehydrogenase